MPFISIDKQDNIAVARMQRGKVNAVNSDAVNDMTASFKQLADDNTIGAVVFTGHDKFFSFGFDVPELLTYSKEELADFLTRFASLKADLFMFPKPLIAAINGHATAGGCMLALTADYRIMVSEKAKISLNEINIGASLFAGSVEMLKFCAGPRNAELIATSGRMYSPHEAHELGVVDQLADADAVLDGAISVAVDYAKKNAWAFQSIKRLLRQPVIDKAIKQEPSAICEFVDIWFTEESQTQLRQVQIRS